MVKQPASNQNKTPQSAGHEHGVQMIIENGHMFIIYVTNYC